MAYAGKCDKEESDHLPIIEQLTVNKLTVNTASGLTRCRSRDGAEWSSAQPRCPNHRAGYPLSLIRKVQ